MGYFVSFQYVTLGLVNKFDHKKVRILCFELSDNQKVQNVLLNNSNFFLSESSTILKMKLKKNVGHIFDQLY